MKGCQPLNGCCGELVEVPNLNIHAKNYPLSIVVNMSYLNIYFYFTGNVFLRQAEIEDPLEDPQLGGDEVYKSVFIIFFQGEQLKSRVKKICEGFRATLYPCPDQAADRREMAVGVMQRLEDLNTVLGQTNDHRHRVLVAAAKNIKLWFVKVRKIKAIYHTLNMFNLDVTQKCLIAECWIPTADIEAIQLALRRGSFFFTFH